MADGRIKKVSMKSAKGIGLRAMGEEAKKLASITEEVLFGDIWRRTELSPRDRSVVTISALAALYRSDELAFHIKLALENEVTTTEIVEIFTHLAFYSGWPTAHSALKLLRQVAHEASNITPAQS